MQIHWAVWYYEVFGYWTSVAGALATWGIIAGLEGVNQDRAATLALFHDSQEFRSVRPY